VQVGDGAGKRFDLAAFFISKKLIPGTWLNRMM